MCQYNVVYLKHERKQFLNVAAHLIRGRIILKWVLRKYSARAWTGFISSGQGRLRTPSYTEMRLRVP